MNRNNAYTTLLMRHRDMLWRLCWRMANGDPDRCSDLLQEVSIALWENFDKLNPDASSHQERAWVRWQARSVFYQIGRKQKIYTLPLNDNLTDNISEEESHQRKELVEDLIGSLAPEEQRMLRLYLEGYSGDEIGKEMGISRNNYYQRMHRTIQKLRYIVLVLLVLIFTSAIAIAIVPQWRQSLFKGIKPQGIPIDTVQNEFPLRSPQKLDPSPADNASEQSSMQDVPEIAHPTIVSLECLPPTELIDKKDTPEELSPRTKNNNLTLCINGTYFTIPGAAGETVRVYDMSGDLVFGQKAGSICFINLMPCFGAYFIEDWYQYKLQIGTRQLMLIKM